MAICVGTSSGEEFGRTKTGSSQGFLEAHSGIDTFFFELLEKVSSMSENISSQHGENTKRRGIVLCEPESAWTKATQSRDRPGSKFGRTLTTADHVKLRVNRKRPSARSNPVKLTSGVK